MSSREAGAPNATMAEGGPALDRLHAYTGVCCYTLKGSSTNRQQTYTRARRLKSACPARSDAADMRGGIGQKGHLPRVLEGGAQAALVLGAGARLAARLDLAPIRKIAAQVRDI